MESKNDQEQKQSPLFREKSLERLSSPEQLHDYMRVTSPRLWMILGTIVALLVGFVVYASTTRMESTVTVKMEAYSYGGISGLIPESSRGVVTENMAVRIGGKTGTINHLNTSSAYCLQLVMDGGRLEDGYYYLTVDGKEPDYSTNTLWINCVNGQVLAEKTREEAILIDQLRTQGDSRVRIWSSDSIKIVYEGRLPATVRLAEPLGRAMASVTLDDPDALAAGLHPAEIDVGGREPLQLNVIVSEYGNIVVYLPEESADSVRAGAVIRIENVTGVIDSIVYDTAYGLEIVSSGPVPADGEYRVTLAGADPGAEDTAYLQVTSVNGRILGGLQGADSTLLEKLRNSDTAVCFWNEPGKVDYQGGRLATVTGVEDYVSTTVSVTLDDPNAILEPGLYDAEIVTESTTPISFLLN